MTDEKGRKIAVQIDLKKYGAVLEDFWDGLVSESRRKEKESCSGRLKRTLEIAVACVNSYTVEVKPLARKELESLPDNVLWRVVAKLEALADNPRPSGSKKLKGYKDQWRIRVGNWRIV